MAQENDRSSECKLRQRRTFTEAVNPTLGKEEQSKGFREKISLQMKKARENPKADKATQFLQLLVVKPCASETLG